MRPTRTTLSTLLALAAAVPAVAQQGQLQWGDYDADGLADALAITPEHGLKLMRNSGDGRFEDATSAARLAGVTGATFGLLQDYDGDGAVDLFVGTESGLSRLFRNQDGTFVDVAALVGINAEGADLAAEWVDYDSDGRLDLFLSYDASNVFFHALPGGTFERVELPSTLVEPAGAQVAILVEGKAAPEPEPRAQALAGEAAGAAAPLAADRQQAGRRTPIFPSQAAAGGGAQGNTSSQGTGGGTSSLGGPFSLGPIAQGVWDLNTGDIVRVSIAPELGKLYPLSNEFFVDPVDGDVVIGSRLETPVLSTPTNTVRVEGLIRAGSEMGTAQGPETAFAYEGVLTRRIATTNTLQGSVVARSQSMRLVRNGTTGQFDIEWDESALNDQVVYGTGLTASGTVIPIVFNFGGPTTAGSQTIFAETDVVRLQLSFGTSFNIRGMTDVTLIRSEGDFWWLGTVTTTVDQ